MGIKDIAKKLIAKAVIDGCSSEIVERKNLTSVRAAMGVIGNFIEAKVVSRYDDSASRLLVWVSFLDAGSVREIDGVKYLAIRWDEKAQASEDDGDGSSYPGIEVTYNKNSTIGDVMKTDRSYTVEFNGENMEMFYNDDSHLSSINKGSLIVDNFSPVKNVSTLIDAVAKEMWAGEVVYFCTGSVAKAAGIAEDKVYPSFSRHCGDPSVSAYASVYGEYIKFSKV